MANKSLQRRWLWFLLIWGASVAVLGLLALLIRLALGL
jgi:hypothetical protein